MTTYTKQSGIDITEKAIKEVLRIKSGNNIPAEHALRVGVKGGGCNGFTYQLGFDGEIKEGDTTIEKDGLKVLVDAKSLFYLMSLHT
jgi:iron-sulfur cluster assembly protein